MQERPTQLYQSVGVRDLVEIAILALAIFVLLRLLGKNRGAGLVAASASSSSPSSSWFRSSSPPSTSPSSAASSTIC